MIKVMGHMILGFLTGGLWWIYLGIRYITR
jgi:hypothetical protein